MRAGYALLCFTTTDADLTKRQKLHTYYFLFVSDEAAKEQEEEHVLVTLFDNSSFRFHRMKQAEGRGSGGAAAPNPLEGDPPLSLFLPFILVFDC